MTGVRRLFVELQAVGPGRVVELGSFYVRCMAHVVNLAAQKGMSEIFDKIIKVERLVSPLRMLVKR